MFRTTPDGQRDRRRDRFRQLVVVAVAVVMGGTGISLVSPGLASATSATPHGLKGEYPVARPRQFLSSHRLTHAGPCVFLGRCRCRRCIPQSRRCEILGWLPGP